MENRAALASLAVQHWKLLRALKRAIERLPMEHVDKTAGQHRYFDKQLKELLAKNGLRLVEFEGRTFEPNIPAEALNADDEQDGNDGAEWIVVATIEPAIVHDMKTLHFGKVIIQKAEEEDADVSRD